MDKEVLNQEPEIEMFEEIDDEEESSEPTETHEDETKSETTEPTNDEAKPSEEFEVKYNGEVLKKSKEELITLAQKGMNYDKVAQERDTLRNSPEIQMLDRLAKTQGLNRQQLMTALEESMAAQEKATIVNELKAKYPDAPEELLMENAEGILAKRNADRVLQENQHKEDSQKERNQRDIQNFMMLFPDVDVRESFTKEMLAEAAQGKGLVTVWQEKLLKDKEAEIEQLKEQSKRSEQEAKNKQQALGSVASESNDESDALLKELLS